MHISHLTALQRLIIVCSLPCYCCHPPFPLPNPLKVFPNFTADGRSQPLCLLRGHPEMCGARAELRARAQLSCTELAQLAQARDVAYLPMEKPPMDNGK